MVLEQTLADYFENIAIKNKLILHTDQTPRFAVGADAANNLMKDVLNIKEFCLVFELLEGSIINNGADTDNEEVPFALYIVKKLRESDYEQRTAVYDGAKTIIRQIVSWIYKDINKRVVAYDHPISSFKKQSKNYIKIEGEMSGVYGYRLDCYVNPPIDLTFNAAEWNS